MMTTSDRTFIKLLIVGVILPVSMGVLLINFCQKRPDKEIKSIQTSSLQSGFQNYGSRLEIKGFQYESMEGAQKTVSIQAERFSVDKKKMGFLRFGLLDEARLENAHIRVHGYPGKNVKGILPDKTYSPQSFFVSPSSKIVSIGVNFIVFELLYGEEVVARIVAKSASTSLKNSIGDIVFRGNVTVTSGNRYLKAEQLILNPKKSILLAEKSVTYSTPGMRWLGQRLELDFLLKPT